MTYKKLNNLSGWGVFAIATIVYLLTMEQTTSLWDCGEYIITANKLEVGHPPGAPLFMMIGRLFSAFASPENAAMMVNSMSALSSSFTILFLFWTITMLGRKLALKSEAINKENTLAIIGSGVVGALAYTFTDSFWFSAVEGEVYAMSSMFTAIVFWAILKWDIEDNEFKKAIDEERSYLGHPNRWILFISFMIGLSVGVHLLNLLAIPAIAFVIYFKKYPFTWKSFFITGILSLVVLAGIQDVIIPGTVSVADSFERLFTNSYGLPFNTGALFFFLLLIGLIYLGIRYSSKNGKPIIYDIVMSFALILIGYSSFVMIVVRSNANPPLDENNPETPSQLHSYLKREQYGSWPVLYGPYFNTPTYEGVFNTAYDLPDGFEQCNDKYLEPAKQNFIRTYCITPNTKTLKIPKSKVNEITELLSPLQADIKFSTNKKHADYINIALKNKELSFINEWDLNDFLNKAKNINDALKQKGYDSFLSFSDEVEEKYVDTQEHQTRNHLHVPDFQTFFPRMWRPGEAAGYMYWAGYEKNPITKLWEGGNKEKPLPPNGSVNQMLGGQPELISSLTNAEMQYNYIYQLANKPEYKSDKENIMKIANDYLLKNGMYQPTFVENLTYLFNYQLGWMYGRYFLWNFAGRQNDVQGFGGTPGMGGNHLMEGNWLSGVDFIDNQRLGNQEALPIKTSENKGYNRYYFLPLILGLIGFFFQLWKHPKGWFTVFLLFLLTGIAIVIYLNQKPWEPRERDYAYAASFYAFAAWIGLSVYALYYAAKKMSFKQLKPVLTYGLGGSVVILGIQYVMEHNMAFGFSLVYLSGISISLFALMILLRKYLKKGLYYAGIPFVLCMTVPTLLAFENWDDHDRSNRSTARDFAHNYLMSCDYNAILFTNGDNDTFPLWYIQEVEGVRTDVRVANMSLLSTDWHINQMKKKAYESDPLPITMHESKYRSGIRDQIIIQESQKNKGKFFSAKEAIDFICNDNNVTSAGCTKMSFLDFQNLYIPVNKENAIKYGLVNKEDVNKMADTIKWRVKGGFLKADLAVLDILANYKWDRPICFASLGGLGANDNLKKYLQSEGLVYKLTPIDHGGHAGSNVQKTYQLLTDGYELNKPNGSEKINFLWGNMNEPGVLVDNYSLNQVWSQRYLAYATVAELLQSGEKEKAVNLLDHTFINMPIKDNQVPIIFDSRRRRITQDLCGLYYKAGEKEKGDKVGKILAGRLVSELAFYLNQNDDFFAQFFNEWTLTLQLINDLRIESISGSTQMNLVDISDKYSSKISLIEEKEKESDSTYMSFMNNAAALGKKDSVSFYRAELQKVKNDFALKKQKIYQDYGVEKDSIELEMNPSLENLGVFENTGLNDLLQKSKDKYIPKYQKWKSLDDLKLQAEASSRQLTNEQYVEWLELRKFLSSIPEVYKNAWHNQ